MDWSNERYVRVYTRDTVTWKLLDWRGKATLSLLFRKVDRAGVLDVGHDGVLGLAAILELPLEVVEPGIAQLTASRGGVPTVVDTGTAYVIPNFLEAQEAPSSDAHRKRESRSRRRDVALAASRQLLLMSGSEAIGHETGQDRHAESQEVTPIRSDPSRSDPEIPLPRAIPPTPEREPAPPATPAPEPPAPAVSLPAPAREDIARTQAIAGDQREASKTSNCPVTPDTWTDQRAIVRPGSGPTHPTPGPKSPPRRDPREPFVAARDGLGQRIVHRDVKPANVPPGEPTLDQLWTELEQARQRAASARGVSIRPLVAHDTGRKDLAEALVEAARVGRRAELVADVRHAIAAAEAESRVPPEPGKRDQLPFFSGAIFSPRNFRRLAGTPVKAAKARPAATAAAAERPRVDDPPLTAEERAEIAELARKVGAGRADAAAAEERARRSSGPAAKSTAELVRMFGHGERAPPASAATEPPTDDEPDMETA